MLYLDLGERLEDAVVDYLKTGVPGDMQVYAAWSMERPTFPCAIVRWANEAPVSELAEWHVARRIRLECAVMVEAVKTRLLEVRDRNRAARVGVKALLDVADLKERLIDRNAGGVKISFARYAGEEPGIERNRLLSTLLLDTIAEPMEEL